MKVYAVAGVPPEVQAYALAKYSRSAQSMVESIQELSAQRAEQFLNTFYFQYGHRSIADLAHLVLGIEDVSILAAMKIVDEQLWDGQERSTRYQPFEKTGFHTPDGLEGRDLDVYQGAMTDLFLAYKNLTAQMLAVLVESVPRPNDMDERAFERTLRARAFDVSRGLLPMSTMTSLGQVVSARVLERQITRLMSDPLPEAQAIGKALRQACQQPAVQPLSAEVDGISVAPTLVKYTAPNPYQIETRQAMFALVDEIMEGFAAPDRSTPVDLLDSSNIDVELVATLLYRYDRQGRSYRQLQGKAWTLTSEQCERVLATAMMHRGSHDELPREFQAGYELAFDILMDIGSFRDLHRHRRCTQIIQEMTPNHGHIASPTLLTQAFGQEIGEQMLAKNIGDQYDLAMARALDAARYFGTVAPDVAPYVLPLATRVRALFKMDLAQALYITDLRTGVGGHFSYRRIAWDMYEALKYRYPSVERMARPTPITDPPDLLRR